MSTFQFTRGPWRLSNDSCYVYPKTPGAAPIAKILGDNYRADARLIFAAPMLFYAAHESLRAIQGTPDACAVEHARHFLNSAVMLATTYDATGAKTR